MTTPEDAEAMRQTMQAQQQAIEELRLVFQQHQAAAAAGPMTSEQVHALLMDTLNRQAENTERILAEVRTDRSRPSLVDARGIGKPGVYTGDEGKFRSWAFKTANFFAGVYPEARRFMKWAQEQEVVITKAALSDSVYDDFGLTLDNLMEIDDQIFTALGSLTDNEPNDIVLNTMEGHGMECWRKLVRRYDPATIGRRRNLMKAVFYPGQAKLAELFGHIDRWEELVRQYETRRDSAGQRQQIPEEMKMGVLQEMCPEVLQTHLYLNASRLVTYLSVKEEIIGFVEAKSGSNKKAGKRPQVDPDAMDVGSLVKGKGRARKARRARAKEKADGGKGQKGEQGAWQSAARFDGTCSNCQKYGHKQRDCWAAGGGAAGKGPEQTDGKKDGKNVNAVDNESSDKNEKNAKNDVGGLDLCSVDNCDKKRYVCGVCQSVDRHGRRKVTVTLDSGAAVCALPEHIGEQFDIVKDSANNVSYKTANGAEVKDMGERILSVQTAEGHMRRMRFRVTGVRKPLASAGDIVAAGNTVILTNRTDQRSRIIHDATKREIDVRLEKGVYVFDVWVDEEEKRSAKYLTPMEQVPEPAQSMTSSGFTRRARWP